MNHHWGEVWWRRTGLAAGAIVAAAVYPSADHILLGFGIHAGCQLAVLSVLYMLGTRPAVMGGAAWALALHLAAFRLWLLQTGSHDPMAWLIYMFCLPGGALACIGLALWHSERSPRPWWFIAGLAFGAVAGGLAASGWLFYVSIP